MNAERVRPSLLFIAVQPILNRLPGQITSLHSAARRFAHLHVRLQLYEPIVGRVYCRVGDNDIS